MYNVANHCILRVSTLSYKSKVHSYNTYQNICWVLDNEFLFEYSHYKERENFNTIL